jgi:hypothetical protein
MDSYTNVLEFTTTDSTNLIYSLYQDSDDRLLDFNNNITLYATDSTGVQISNKIKKDYLVRHINCETPLITPIITDGISYNT